MNSFEKEQYVETAAMTDEMSVFPAQISLAMAYVPMQRFENLYDDEKGFDVGTVFSALNKPFTGGKK